MLALCVFCTRDVLFRFKCFILFCDNDVLMVWLGLGTQTTWLGLGKYHVLTYMSLTRLEILPVFHQKYPLLLPQMHSSAPRMVPLPKPRSRSSDFGVFACVILECGGNMDAKKKLFHTLLLKVFKHQVDCSFQYLCGNGHDFGKRFLPSTQCLPLSAMFQHPMTWTQLVQLSKLLLWLERAFTWILQVG